MSSKNLSDLERQYFARKVDGGTTPQEPLNQIKRRYFCDYLNLTNGYRYSFADLEDLWLKKFIDDNGGTLSGSYPSALWKQAVSAIGGTPTRQMNGNKIIFFSTAP